MIGYAALFLLGVLVFSGIEYVHHRHAGHLRLAGMRLHRSHQMHHGNAQEGGVTLLEKYRQRAPLVIVVSALIAAPLALLLPLPQVCAFMLGLIGGYLYSEGFHHRMHHRLPRGRVQIWLWWVHYYHHYHDTSVNYGFSSPLWDVLLGTLRQPQGEVRVPRAQAPAGLEHIPGFALRSSKTPPQASGQVLDDPGGHAVEPARIPDCPQQR